MKTLLAIVVALAIVLSLAMLPSDPISLPGGVIEHPVANVPVQLRQSNWKAASGHGRNSIKTGSCVHASMVTALRWQGMPEMADWWKANHGGADGPGHIEQEMDAAGLNFVETHDVGDEAFLEWSIATRRGCLVGIANEEHCVFLCDMDETRVALIDNNNTSKVYWVPREAFMRDWKQSHSWALAVTYSPAPPLSGEGP